MLLPADKSRSKEIPKVVSPTGGKQMGLVHAEIELISVDDIVLSRHGFLSEDRIPRQQRLIVNPESPDIATRHLK